MRKLTLFDTILRTDLGTHLILKGARDPMLAWIHEAFAFAFRFGDHYEWNKVTTCVHNILSGRRWIEHYGEITIRNTKSSACLCKLTFVKVAAKLPLCCLPKGKKAHKCVFFFFCSLRETTGAPTSTRCRGSWWTRKAKSSTGSLGNGTKASTAASRLLLNVSGGQVRNPSPPSAWPFGEN